jgi:hypothetical protein
MSAFSEVAPRPEFAVARPPITPPFTRKIGALVTAMGYGEAVSEVFSDAGISIELEGGFPTASAGGLIIASNHLERLEPLLVQATLSGTGHDGSYVLAAPFSVAGRLIQATGDKGRELVVPVVRSDFADPSRSDFGMVDRYRLSKFPDVNNPSEVLRAANARSLSYATGRVASGNTLTICPTGYINDAAVEKWQSGLGKVVQGLPADAHETTYVSVFEAKVFSKARFLSALMLRDMGIRPKRQTVVFGASTMGTVSENFADDLASEHPHTAHRIVGKVKDHFVAALRANT